jgi:hypothetical protein
VSALNAPQPASQAPSWRIQAAPSSASSTTHSRFCCKSANATTLKSYQLCRCSDGRHRRAQDNSRTNTCACAPAVCALPQDICHATNSCSMQPHNLNPTKDCTSHHLSAPSHALLRRTAFALSHTSKKEALHNHVWHPKSWRVSECTSSGTDARSAPAAPASSW